MNIEPTAMIDPDAIARFVRGGNAHFTIRSKRTGTRFTYRARATDRGDAYFVSVLTGSDNTSHYTYMGLLICNPDTPPVFTRTRASKVEEDAPCYKAFVWFYRNIAAQQSMQELEFWHEGRCGRCARKLTVPESIASGFGPECITRVFRAEAA